MTTETLSQQTFSDLLQLGNKFGKVTKDGDHYVLSFRKTEGFTTFANQVLDNNKDLISKDSTIIENLQKLYNYGTGANYTVVVVEEDN